jgi:heptosyltransferase-2
LRQLASRLTQHRWDVVLDTHNTLRSNLLLGLMGRRPDARLAKDTAARLAFMKFGRSHPRLILAMRDRFETVVSTGTKTELTALAQPPLAHFGTGGRNRTATTQAPLLGVAPGAKWDTKRWPQENFATLLSLYLKRTHGAARVYLGPQERQWYEGSSLANVVVATESASTVAATDLRDVARNLGGLDLVIANDSGLLHLAEAVGTPVLALFGPTVREFGYYPLLAESRVLETDLSCRPCSRNGKRPCHRNDLACLTGISADLVMQTLLTMLTKECHQ